MALSPTSILEEEILHLKELKTVLETEREGLVSMDREALKRSHREKEHVASRLQELNEMRRSGEVSSQVFLPHGPKESDLLRVRMEMAREVRERCRVQGEILHAQGEQVGQLLAFLQSLRCQAAVYDRTGRLKRT
jgi:flagellar biosynthesis/type III secretory pathway chaperone